MNEAANTAVVVALSIIVLSILYGWGEKWLAHRKNKAATNSAREQWFFNVEQRLQNLERQAQIRIANAGREQGS